MARWIRPTLDTKFNIDLDWWDQNNRDLRVYLHQQLCKDCREIYSSHLGSETVDWIDPDTAEVQPVDGLWHTLRTHCSREPDYITESTPMVNAILRVFLANGNAPLTPAELGAKIGQPPEKILRVIGRGHVYDGIKPVM
jgi:hypothetical protein